MTIIRVPIEELKIHCKKCGNADEDALDVLTNQGDQNREKGVIKIFAVKCLKCGTVNYDWSPLRAHTK